MAASISISGLDDCLRFFDQAPANLMKVSRKAMRDASKATAGVIRKRVPKRWRRLVRYAVDKDFRSGKLGALVGLFQIGLAQGHQNPNQKAQIPDWFKAYWLNYGTLDNRDPEHQFKYSVRHRGTAQARRRRNTTGVKPQHFFEAATPGWQETFVESFQESLKKQEKDLYDR